jgi:putative membrane protein
MIVRQIFSARIGACVAAALLACAGTMAQNPSTSAPSQQPQQPQTQMPSGSTMGSPDTGSATTAQQFGEQAFVSKALEGSDAEVQLGQLAQQKSQSNDVKQFAQKMVEDHSALNEKLLKPVAKQLGVPEPKGPSKKDKKLIAKLDGLSGPEFDTEYITAMVKDHQQDLKSFKDEAEMAQDLNVKSAAQQGAGLISAHLQMIEQIAQNHNIAVEGKTKQVSSMQ